jgi:hypothetical protein
MDLTETTGVHMERIDMAQDRDQWSNLVNTVVNLWVSQNAWKFLSSCTTGSLSRRAPLYGFTSQLCLHNFALTQTLNVLKLLFITTTAVMLIPYCLTERLLILDMKPDKNHDVLCF